MTTDYSSQIAEIHAVYCSSTGFNVRLAYDRERAWYDWLNDGFTAKDLLLVIEWLKREIKAQRRWEASLTFRNLIVQRDRFDEDLQVATAHARRPVQTARDRELERLRPTAPNQTTLTTTASAVPVAAVSAKALELLRACKASL